ncbi:sialin-like isoform X1 [Diprion similis]|uniref:sialin-like isoform X1 n=1 Tax=Diprion similis TaxID=362088 RepID=UPI001EF94731|nr:sialin-like isoform X1 [Diprion similis]
MVIRYAIAIMILLAKCSIYMLRAQMSFAILTMVPRNRVLIQTDDECFQNATSMKISENHHNHHSPIRNWSELSMCGVLAAYYAGFYSTELFGSYVATFSPKSVISWLILLPSIANTLIPLFLRFGKWTIFFMRVFIGICAGLNQESFAILTLKWASPDDRVLFSGSLYEYCGVVLYCIKGSNSELQEEYLGQSAVG